MYKFICEHCGNEFERKVNKHQRFCSNSCRAKHCSVFVKSDYIPYNYDSTKIRFCLDCGSKLGNGNKSGYCRKCYIKHCDIKEKQSKWAKEHHIGGYNFGAGGGKKGKYDNILFDSSWELAFYLYHKDHNLYIERCTEIRKYKIDGIEKNYIPDFITDDGIIEIKGYDTKVSIAKAKYNPDIKILRRKEMQKYLDYVIKTYGKDFTKLYN
jgi:hypothetical protein